MESLSRSSVLGEGALVGHKDKNSDQVWIYADPLRLVY